MIYVYLWRLFRSLFIRIEKIDDIILFFLAGTGQVSLIFKCLLDFLFSSRVQALHFLAYTIVNALVHALFVQVDLKDRWLERRASSWYHPLLCLRRHRLCQMSYRLLYNRRIVQDVWRVLLRRFPNVMISFGGNIRISSESWRWCSLVLSSTIARLLTSVRLVFTRCDCQLRLRELNILLNHLLIILEQIVVGQRSLLDGELEWIKYFVTFALLEKEIIIVNFRTLLMIHVYWSIVLIVLKWGRIRICLLLRLLLMLLLFLLVS